MTEQITAFALFGLWTVICVMVGAGLQFRRQRGDHPSAGAVAGFDMATAQLKKLMDVVRRRHNIPQEPDKSKEPEL